MGKWGGFAAFRAKRPRSAARECPFLLRQESFFVFFCPLSGPVPSFFPSSVRALFFPLSESLPFSLSGPNGTRWGPVGASGSHRGQRNQRYATVSTVPNGVSGAAGSGSGFDSAGICADTGLTNGSGSAKLRDNQSDDEDKKRTPARFREGRPSAASRPPRARKTTSERAANGRNTAQNRPGFARYSATKRRRRAVCRAASRVEP